MTAQDLLKLVFGLLGSKTASGGVRNSEVYAPPVDTLMSAQSRFNFHRDAYRFLLNLSVVLGLTLIGLIGANAWIVITAAPQDRFFVAAVDGRVQALMPIDLPNASSDEVFSRVGKGVVDSLTFGYLDQDFRRAELTALFLPGIIETIQKAVVLGDQRPEQLARQMKSFVTEFDGSRPAGILQQGENKQTSIYEWLVQIPVLVTVKLGIDNTPSTVQPYTIRVVAQRSRSVESRYGYFIARLESVHPDGPATPAGRAAVVSPNQPEGSTP